MGYQLTRVDDDRDDLEKMSRDALWLLAKAKGVADKFPDGHNTPAVDHTNLNRPNMVAILRSLGVKGIKSDRILGSQVPEVTVAADILKTSPVILDKTPKPSVPDQHALFIERQKKELDRTSERIAQLGIETSKTDSLAENRKENLNVLRSRCREFGIEVKVTDNSRTLLKKLRTHGQNSA